MTDTKTCKGCNNEFLLIDFPVRQDAGKISYRNKCKTCESKARLTRRITPKTPEQRQRNYRYLSEREKMMRRSDEYRAKIILRDSRNSDRKKNRENDLTEEFIQQEINNGCSYCGNTHKMTIDRIDNSKGHTRNNVLPACLRCNLIRGCMPYKAWMTIVPNVKFAFEQGLFEDWMPKKS